MAQEWISVTDRLPQKMEDVLAWDGKSMRICWFDWGFDEWCSYNDRAEGITYWMPLPEPPKEEE